MLPSFMAYSYSLATKKEREMPPEYVDYLILGDEHHGETYSDIKSTRRPYVQSMPQMLNAPLMMSRWLRRKW